MTSDIAQILSKYKGRDVNDILNAPSLARDITIIGQGLDEAEAETAEEGRNFLNRILDAIDAQVETLQMEQGEQKDSIDHIKKMSDACVAYTKNKGKEKG